MTPFATIASLFSRHESRVNRPRRAKRSRLVGIQSLESRIAYAADFSPQPLIRPAVAPPDLSAYVLSAPFAPPDNAGNSSAAARAITLRSTTDTYSDWVGSTDTNDFYRFTLGETADFRLTLDGMTADADVELQNSSGTTIRSSTAGGTTAESIARQLTAGTYYIRVYPYSGSTNYALKVSAASLAPPDNAGNSLAAARAITLRATIDTYSDWVGPTDINDFYRFTLGGTADFRLALDGMTADADVQLQNASGTTIASSTAGSTTAESIAERLTAGTYYIRVYPYSGSTTYALKVSAAGLSPPDNAGNSLTAARAITVRSTTDTYSDWVGPTDINDFYRFTLGGTADFRLALDGMTADADVQLQNASGTTIASSTAGGTTAESIAERLTAGTYYVRVYPYSGSTNYSLRVSATAQTPPPDDWFSQNLRDPELVALTRSLAGDGILNRTDMLAVLRSTTDGGGVDAAELADVRTVAANAARFGMPADVRFLANCVTNGNAANARSGIGDLAAGASQAQLESLVSKWFFGAYRPATSYGYSRVAGALFQNGPAADDVNQNALGDCYFMCTLSSIAQEKPTYVSSMFVDNGDDTWGVRFFRNGVTEYVTVDRFLPTSNGFQIYAGWGGGAFSSSANELWVALAEKAYAQLAELGWSRPNDTRNAYAAIVGGWMDPVIEQVTGLRAAAWESRAMTAAQLVGIVGSSQIATVGFGNGGGFGVVNLHAYSVTSYDATTGRFRLRNPWGTQHADVTFAQIQQLQGRVIASTT